MASNNLADPFQATICPPILKPWTRWSWKALSVETAPESPPKESLLNSIINSTVEASITTSKQHPRLTSSETIESVFSSSSKEEADFSYDGSHSSSSDDEDIFFHFNDHMSTQVGDNSSQSSVSQPSTPGKSERSSFQSSVASETGDSVVESELPLLFDDALELKSTESITIITTEGEKNNEEREEHTVVGNGLKDEELSPREFALEKRRIMIEKLISGRKDELGMKFLEQLSYNRVGPRFGGWSAYPEFTNR